MFVVIQRTHSILFLRFGGHQGHTHTLIAEPRAVPTRSGLPNPLPAEATTSDRVRVPRGTGRPCASRPDAALFGRELHVGALFRRLRGRLPDLARVRDPHPAAAFEVEVDLT